MVIGRKQWGRVKNFHVNPIIFKTFFHTFLKTELNLPRHERDEVLTRSCWCLVTFVSRPWQLRVEVFLYRCNHICVYATKILFLCTSGRLDKSWSGIPTEISSDKYWLLSVPRSIVWVGSFSKTERTFSVSLILLRIVCKKPQAHSGLPAPDGQLYRALSPLVGQQTAGKGL